ncbi:hypothetical protein [Gordonibacter sp.]
MLDAQGVKQSDVARSIGKSPQFVNDSIRRENMRVSTAASIAQAAGCEIVIRKAGERDGIIITAED